MEGNPDRALTTRTQRRVVDARGGRAANPWRTYCVMRIAASTVVPADRAAVFGFLAERRNHHLLIGRRIELLELADAPGCPIKRTDRDRRPARTAQTRPHARGRRRRAVASCLDRPARRPHDAKVSRDLRPTPHNQTRAVLSATISSWTCSTVHSCRGRHQLAPPSVRRDARVAGRPAPINRERDHAEPGPVAADAAREDVRAGRRP
jgi:hypothetical protein